MPRSMVNFLFNLVVARFAMLYAPPELFGSVRGVVMLGGARALPFCLDS